MAKSSYSPLKVLVIYPCLLSIVGGREIITKSDGFNIRLTKKTTETAMCMYRCSQSGHYVLLIMLLFPADNGTKLGTCFPSLLRLPP